MFDLGAGSQVHDYQPGISSNDLFWVTEIPKWAFGGSRDSAWLRVSDLALVDTFVFNSPKAVPARLSFEVHWHRTGTHEERGSGKDVDPTDPAAFSGSFAAASATGKGAGVQLGFGFETGTLTSKDFFAQIGTERNGVFL